MKVINLALLLLFISCKNQAQNYVCTPCDLSCDTLIFESSGKCSQCSMQLIKESEAKRETLVVNEVNISEGSGKFLIEGGKGKKTKAIIVYYYKPKNFDSNSKVLVVIPGAGRNANTYRDAWVAEADKKGILILSPKYAEEDYAFEDYHLCGLIRELNLGKSLEFVENSNMVKIDEDQLTFTLNTKEEEWIFEDFDRIFDLAIEAIGSNQKEYDIFGHSAGGQILHRYALFGKSAKVNNILAANSGFYTLPNFEFALPFGLKNTLLEEQNLQDAFDKKLIILVGELDNQAETRGTLLRSSTADKQGLHRLARAQYFYDQAKSVARSKQFSFNWKIAIIPQVGHDHRKMAVAASQLLYSEH
ncbi:MAG: hypothetical protein ABJN95_00955 [Maribacter sp.]|uniref:hypothetical protein n=1 Tax=Maribacter sp. TaxID=1897614 RepID=UPI003299738B